MILTGMMDSPFVRRAALALRLHGVAFEHRALSVLRDAAAVSAFNPLGRAPVLSFADGTHLADSRAIVEWVEAAHPMPGPEGEAFRELLALEAVAIGVAEKAVARSAETRRAAPEAAELARIDGQLARALDWLDARASGGWLIGGALTRADLALACATTYIAEKHPGLGPDARPGLAAHRAFCEARAPFKDLPFVA
ncbi:glutathione S-transferase family protein [Rhodobacterales bacterium HKCCE2091]|nr:glutathione S-transferase family protein [Rhodobacterales bacterium HKCCE2091]